MIHKLYKRFGKRGHDFKLRMHKDGITYFRCEICSMDIHGIKYTEKVCFTLRERDADYGYNLNYYPEKYIKCDDYIIKNLIE